MVVMLKKHRLPRLVRLDVFSCAFLEMTKLTVSKAYISVARRWSEDGSGRVFLAVATDGM